MLKLKNITYDKKKFLIRFKWRQILWSFNCKISQLFVRKQLYMCITVWLTKVLQLNIFFFFAKRKLLSLFPLCSNVTMCNNVTTSKWRQLLFLYKVLDSFLSALELVPNFFFFVSLGYWLILKYSFYMLLYVHVCVHWPFD